MRHGQRFEEHALRRYQETYAMDILNAGIIICSKFPWYGFSPDGIVVDQNGMPQKLLEIKCPVIGRYT